MNSYNQNSYASAFRAFLIITFSPFMCDMWAKPRCSNRFCNNTRVIMLCGTVALKRRRRFFCIFTARTRVFQSKISNERIRSAEISACGALDFPCNSRQAPLSKFRLQVVCAPPIEISPPVARVRAKRWHANQFGTALLLGWRFESQFMML